MSEDGKAAPTNMWCGKHGNWNPCMGCLSKKLEELTKSQEEDKAYRQKAEKERDEAISLLQELQARYSEDWPWEILERVRKCLEETS